MLRSTSKYFQGICGCQRMPLTSSINRLALLSKVEEPINICKFQNLAGRIKKSEAPSALEPLQSMCKSQGNN